MTWAALCALVAVLVVLVVAWVLYSASKDHGDTHQ